MSLLGWLSSSSSFLGWDAVKDRGKRRPVKRYVYSQDTHLRDVFRDRMLATTLDAQRNFGLCAWMVRKHLDYVSSFSFQGTTEDEDFNRELERYMLWRSKNCDVRGRHPLRRIVRLIEATRTVMGDVGLQKIQSGKYRGLIQAIEPDLIRRPDKYPDGTQDNRFDSGQWINGVRVDEFGRSVEYAICKRMQEGGYQLGTILGADELIHCGYFDRFDQVRGISPLAASLNAMSDYYESSDMAFMKIKLASSFGLVTYRDSGDPLPGTEATADVDGDGILESEHEVDLSGGPWSLEYGTDDRVELLESKTPPAEMVNFLQLSVDLIIKALDLPLAFFDESKPTFHGGQASLRNYERACREKRSDLQDVLNELTDWWVQMAVADGDLVLPAGMQPDDIVYEWVPGGSPYWNLEKEIASEIQAMAAGLDNPFDAAKRHGRDFKGNIDKIALAQEYAESKGVKLSLTGASSAPPAGFGGDTPQDDASQPEDDEPTDTQDTEEIEDEA